MNLLFNGIILAQTAQTNLERDVFQWGRIHQNSDWIAPIAVAILAFIFISAVYKKDAAETSRSMRWFLRTLRFTAVLAALIMYLQPQWRHERETTIPSRAVLIVDTSLSMAIADEAPLSGGEKIKRWDAVQNVVGNAALIDSLREKRDVQILAFDSGVRELAFLPKFTAKPKDQQSEPKNEKTSEKDKAFSTQSIPETLNRVEVRGQQTRLSDSVSGWLKTQRNTPISAVALLSDGAQNVGATPESAAEGAAARQTQIHTVGVGATQIPANVRVYNVQSPQRVQPNDPFAVTAFIQNQAFEGKSVVIDLMDSPEGKSEESLVATQTVILAAPEELQKVVFEVPPQPLGKKKYTVKIRPSAAESDKTDNSGSVVVDSVDRKLQILLFAGGPSREYQFIRTLLARDKTVEVDTYLQTARGNISQEGRKILDEFPAKSADLFAYDGIIAIDPDFNALTADQIKLIETWVGDRSGGLMYIAGPVYLGEPIRGWRENAACKPLLNILPVEFPRRFSAIGSSRETSVSAFPIQFTREGEEAEFLRLDDAKTESDSLWNEFEGFFSYFPVDRVKDAAVVYARFSDPKSESRGQFPPLIAEQFYGSGRTMYIGSGELWRLRGVEPALYDRLMIQLVRRCTQGCMMRQSERGTFLPRQDKYYLGDIIEVHAQLTDVSGAPMNVPELFAEMVSSDGKQTIVPLKPDSSRAGAYAGQVPAESEGSFVFRLKVPGSDVVLECTVRVELSDLERRNPRRDESVLKTWAQKTGGTYFNQVKLFNELALNPSELELKFPDNAATVIAAESIDSDREEKLMKWLIGIIAALLCAEWLTRRLIKLA